MTKTEQAINLWEEGKKKEALRIFKSFRIGITRDDRCSLSIAYECLSGKEDFYSQLGKDISAIKLQAAEIVEKLFLKQAA